MFGLQHLIAPLSVEDFIGTFWGRQAVYIPGGADKFKDLFGWPEVNSYLNGARPNYDGFRLVHEKNPLPPASFERIDDWLRKGATLVINQVQMIDAAMKQFNEMLGADLNTPINTNCYVSCPAKQGFDNHFDEHCVFIVQTEGRKAWKVFRPTLTYPLHAQSLTDKGKPPDVDPYIECVMNPGDVLFIPRGHWHYAIAESPSVHLTVGVTSRTGAEFLGWLSAQLMNSVEFFRPDFPIAASATFNGPVPSASLQAHLDEFRQRMTDLLKEDALMESLVRYCMSGNPVRRNRRLPEDWMLAERITPDTVFEIPPAQKALVRYDAEKEFAVVHVRGHMLQLNGIPEGLMPIFETAGVSLSGQALLEMCPSFDWARLRPLLLQLCQHGLLEVSESDRTLVGAV